MTKQIPLTRGYVALVDDEDYGRVMEAGPWSARPQPHAVYAQRVIQLPGGRKSTQTLHQFLTGRNGIDHRDCDGLNNQRANLQAATASQQSMNRRVRRDSTSGYKGVSWSSQKKRWLALIYPHGRRGKRRYLGFFASAEVAARVYDAAALEHFGEFARLNFPLDTP